MKTYSWDWTNGGVRINCNGRTLVEIGSRFPSRDGLRLVDAADECQPDRMQSSDHGCAKYSMQMFRGDDLVADVNL